MRLGFHVSIEGGFLKAIKRAEERMCETIQIFSRNPRGWQIKELSQKEVKLFREELNNAHISPLIVHLPYLPNLASPDEILYQKSIESFQIELKRADLLGADYLVFHPGKRGGLSVKEGLKRVSEGLKQAFDKVQTKVKVLVENTSGQGSEVCWSFSEIAEVLKVSHDKNQLGVCLDTAHAFSAGYNLSNRRGVEEMLEEFDKFINLERLSLVHLNDSRVPCGSRIDRHEDIGKGYIGIQGFRVLVNHLFLSRLPFIMETPWKGLRNDLKNLKTVKRLLLKVS